MKLNNTHIVIIGNGVAGNSASSAIREKSKEVDITMISQDPFPEYSVCVLSKKYITGEMKREEVFLKDIEDYSRENIKNIFGKKVTGIDVHKKEVILERSKILYDKLIIATGSNPIIPPIEGINKKGVFTLKTLTDADNIASYQGRKAVVLGPGYIGVETGIALKKSGWEVSLVGGRTGIILRTIFDKEPSRRLRELIEGYGIQVFTGEAPVKIIGNVCVSGLITDKREINCDMVILTLGMRPEIELARRAGIEIGGLGGIKVDEQMMTSAKDIYACGDCVETRDIITGENRLCLFWYNAKQQGKIAGFNSVGIGKRFPGTIAISTVDVLGTFGVSIGHTSESFRDGKLMVIEGGSTWYHRLLLAEGVLVGAQLVGKSNDIGSLVSAIRRGDPVERLQIVLRDGNLLSKNPLCVQLSPYMGSLAGQSPPKR